MKRYIVSLIIISIITFPFAFHYTKTPIAYATYDKLVQTDEIGRTLAEDILIYVRHNPNCKIEDLDVIRYIGKDRIKALKKTFRN